MKKHLYILISLIFSGYLHATIINIPADQPTIQAGIDEALIGDTVLVQPGTYFENINYNGKNITVASLFLITQDTSYISQTTIDAEGDGCVVSFNNGEDTTAVLCGFTITNGYAYGGGISCNSSHPTLKHLLITNNTGQWIGGGILCDNSSPVLQNLTISYNEATGTYWGTGAYGGGLGCENGSNPAIINVIISNNIARTGGGIYCDNSSPDLESVTILDNSAENSGGGIECYGNSNPSLVNVIIFNNSAAAGGGICCNNSNPVLTNVQISNNAAIGYNWGAEGGGIHCNNGSNMNLQFVTISNNTAILEGGGIYCSNSSLVFDSIDRCNIYFNSAFHGNDLYSNSLIEVIVDTFTVIYPTDYHAHPPEYFSFDILHGKVEQVDADIYVSPEGDNSNSGLTSNDPLRNIFVAFSKILADSLNPHTIYLLEGTYSSSSTEEVFPIIMLDYISLSGESQNNVILDAEGQSNVLNLDNITGSSIMHLTITGGAAGNGGGIVCNYSNVSFQNLTVSNNIAIGYGDNKGGGIFCNNSNITMQEMSINNNSADHGGGIYYSGGICPVFENVIISNNYASNNAGGIYCLGGECQDFKNVTISGNVALNDGGGMYFESCTPLFDSINRCNIYLNHAFRGNDLYTNTLVEVIVDTFTVLQPTEFHADPFENFAFDVLNGKIEQVDADLYVSPDGDNLNSGLSVNDPLKTIRFAFSKIQTSSVQQNTIHILEGMYGPSSNGESFPLYMLDYFILAGESDSTVILDAEGLSSVLTFDYNSGTTVSGLTLTGGSAEKGGGIYCHYSDPLLQNLIISENTAQYGGAIYCEFAVPHLQNINITNNTSSERGGGIHCENSNPIIQNVTLLNNNSSWGGAISCSSSSLSLLNVQILDNTATWGGGIACLTGSSPELTNVTLSNNIASASGGAIYCETSYLSLQDVIVTNNNASGSGGGLYLYDADPILEGITITGNSASSFGGGIYCYNSGLELYDAGITGNTAGSGGGIYLNENIFSVLHDVAISENMADDGGGICLEYASPELKNVKIFNNEAEGNEGKGGGIFCSEDSNPSLENVTINNNSATNGGGIYSSSPGVQFHETNRCNIYFNDAVRGNDLYSEEAMELVVDTLTVFYPHDYYVEPFGNFSFDIWNEKIQQVNADLYISQYGNNSNSGLWAGNALKTLKYAFSIVRADSLNPKTFYLLNGTYGSTSSGETMPVNVVDNISIEGESDNNVFIDGENLTSVFEFLDNHSSSLANMRIKNGDGYGIQINNSNLELSNITIFNNSTHGIYGKNCNLYIEDVSVILNGASGIYCENTSMNIHNSTISQNNEYGIYCHTGISFILENSNITGNANRGLFLHTINFSILDELLIDENYGGGIRLGFSNPIITNCVISNNHAEVGGGLNCSNNSNPFLNKVLITNNSASNRGGGIYFNYASDPVIVNVEITNNTAEIGAGIACFGSCDPTLTNITIANNSSNDIAGAIYSYTSSNPIITNSILWNNLPEEIYGSTLNITFSDIQGGWEGEGNENVDPSFIGSGDYPFALSDQSLCINEGNPDTTGLNLPEFDLAGNLRFRGGRIDMGAFENQNVITSISSNMVPNTFDLSCKPNPFKDELTIAWNQTETGYTSIEIYNSAGKQIKEFINGLFPKGKNQYRIEARNINPGVYYLKIQAENKQSIMKIIKI